MIIGIEGGLGSGKTLLMVRYLLKDYLQGHKIYANIGLNNIEYEVIDMSKILEMHKNAFNLSNCTLGIDELTVFADCRKSGSKLNRLISYFILQSRKRNVDIYFTTQDTNMIDFRLLNYMDFQVLCEKVIDKNGETLDNYRRYRLFDLRDVRNIKIHRFILKIDEYFKYYDTNEVILPI